MNENYLKRIPDYYFLTRYFLQEISKHINFNEIKNIMDIGSRDCEQSIELSKVFIDANVYAFEANPESVEICKRNIIGNNRILFDGKAVTNYNGIAKFYPIDMNNSPVKNIGASSLLKLSNGHPVEKWYQKEIEVPCTRIDTWCDNNGIKNVDMIWMDVQGAELSVLEGFGDYLKTLKVIHTEIGLMEMYHGQSLLNDLNKFLINNGFVFIKQVIETTEKQETDVIYINRELMK